MSAPTVIYRWYFRDPSLAASTYAEGELEDVGRVGDPRLLMRVSLVRDGMRRPGKLIDLDEREGQRVYCMTVTDDDRLRVLAYLAPIEGQRLAYGLIYDAVASSPDAVEKYGDGWLSGLFGRGGVR